MMTKKKIIVLHSTAGMGHKKAAMAIFDALKTKEADIEFEIIDLMEYAGKFYRFLYLNFYVFLMTRAKWLWGAMYYFSNNPIVDALTRGMRGILDVRGCGKLVDLLVEKNPDAIIATHFFLPNTAKIFKKNNKLVSKMFTVITDYGPHSFWLSDYIDKFFVGSEFALKEVLKRGVPMEKLDVSGIPTGDEFRKDFDKDNLCKVYNLDKTKKTIFLMSGGFGVGPIEKILLSLNSCKASIQVITVCGHNKDVYDDVELLKEKLEYPVILFGFTDKVAELMLVSDLMVSKAGGISVTEALDSRLPMILFASMPGQETWNEHFLLGSGAAERAAKVEDIPVIANRMLLSGEVYDSHKEAIEKIRRPYAAQRIVDVVLEEIGK